MIDMVLRLKKTTTQVKKQNNARTPILTSKINYFSKLLKYLVKREEAARVLTWTALRAHKASSTPLRVSSVRAHSGLHFLTAFWQTHFPLHTHLPFPPHSPTSYVQSNLRDDPIQN